MPEKKPYYALELYERQATLFYFEQHLKLLIHYKDATQELLDGLKKLFYPDIPDKDNMQAVPGSNPLDSNIKQRMAELALQVSDTEAKIPIAEYHVKVYSDRVDDYMPLFEEESKETNLHWNRVWEEAGEIANTSGNTSLSMVLSRYPMEDQNDPEKFSQELKNETYKNLVKQIKTFKKGKKTVLRKA